MTDRPGVGPVHALMLHSGGAIPHLEPRRNAVAWWTPHVLTHLALPTWEHGLTPSALGDLGRIGLAGGNIHPLPLKQPGSLSGARRLVRSYRMLAETLKARRAPIDVVVCYGALWTGLSGILIGRELGVPVVVSVPGHPYRGILYGEGRFKRPRAALAALVARYVLKRATGIHLLYEGQIDDLSIGRPQRQAFFHDFTPIVDLVDDVAPETGQDILLIGYPWHLKGVDLLISAFLRIADKHPDVGLHLVGHCPDRSEFESLAAGHPRIRMTQGVPQATAHELIRNCRVFALASRTEGTARVLLEASAAGRPIVASRVDGTPHLIRHEENGLLFESENVADLAAQLDRVLSDTALAQRLGETARRVVQERYTELHYARAMVGLIYRAVGREPPPDDAFVAPPAHDTTD